MNLDDRWRQIDRSRVDTAQQLLSAGRPNEAIKVLDDFTRQVPDDPDALNLLGVAYSMTGNAPAAEQNLRRALSLIPHNPDFLTNLAQHFANSGRHEEARSLYARALQSRPDHAPSRAGINQFDRTEPTAGKDLDLVAAQHLMVSKVTAGAARCHMILDELYAHRRSLELGVGVDLNERPLPIYTYPAIEYLRQFDYSTYRILEWGSGNSTRWWAERCESVVAVEDDEKWVEFLTANLPTNVEVLAADTVEVYVQCFGDQEDLFEVIIIDGNYRFECIRQAPAYLKEAGMIIVDNSDYHPESARFLRERDFIQLDFTGFKPTHDDVQTTSVFLHRNFLPKLLLDVQPLSGIGAYFQVRRHEIAQEHKAHQD